MHTFLYAQYPGQKIIRKNKNTSNGGCTGVSMSKKYGCRNAGSACRSGIQVAATAGGGAGIILRLPQRREKLNTFSAGKPSGGKSSQWLFKVVATAGKVQHPFGR
jgi:hypothetical protein